SAVLTRVLPCMIAAHAAAVGQEAVIFSHRFPVGLQPARAATGLVDTAIGAAASIGICLRPTAAPLESFCKTIGEFGLAVRRQGKRLWILLDEIQLRHINR